MNWNTDNTITKEMGRETFATVDIIKLFQQLQRDGYSGLSLGLVIDLVRELENN
jgi:hypothetical protein